jgi:hypothetical protein
VLYKKGTKSRFSAKKKVFLNVWKKSFFFIQTPLRPKSLRFFSPWGDLFRVFVVGQKKYLKLEIHELCKGPS